MSLEFGIEFSCAVRRKLTERQLRELSRLANINSRMVEQNINSQEPPTSDMIRFIERSQPRLQQLEEILPLCRQCPANLAGLIPGGSICESLELRGESIGCLGRINYPIDEVFEHFLANRLQLILDTVLNDDWPRAIHVLVDRESPFDGEGTKELRRITTPEGLRFFAMRIAIPLHRKGAHLSTDNIFDMLAGFTTTDSGASGYARELPVMALADYNELFETIFDANLLVQEREYLSSISTSFCQYLRYAEAIKRADELQVRMLID